MSVRQLAAAAAAAALVGGLTACGSGDSTVSKTPVASSSSAVASPSATPGPPPPPPPPATEAAPPTPSPPDPCAVNLAAPAIAAAVSELPRDTRSQQGWNSEPVAGNYNECAQLSAVIIKANTNADNPSTRAVLFHLGKYIPSGVPDTFGFNGIDASQSNGDTVALQYSGGLGLNSIVRFHWNGSAVELIGNTPG